jgi:hypothetical protein
MNSNLNIPFLLAVQTNITSLDPVGTFGVWFTGFVLDATQNDWSYVFTMIASINVLGALAFLVLFDSEREFD